MIITFDLNGRDRKELVSAIAEITGARPVYKSMPTCAYEIDFFTVTKEGMLEFPDRSDTEIVEKVLDGLAERGFEMQSGVYENGESAMFDDNTEITEILTPPDTAAVTEAEVLSEETEKSADTAAQPETDDTDCAGFSVSLNINMFDDHTLENLDRIIESKGELFKKAFQTDDLSYEKTDEKVTFAWFPEVEESEEVTAYCTFIAMLCKCAKEQKRVNSSKTQTENPKFAMRVFLIRLGMVGAEFKTTRKILLRNLEGSSAFRKGAPHNEDTE